MTATKPRTFGLFVLPACLIYAAFVLWPIGRSVALALGDPGGFGRLVTDARFWLALSNNALLVVVSLVLQLPAALGLALLLCGRLPGRGVLRTIYFAPMIVPTAAIGFLWKFLYQPTGWLGDPNLDLFAIALVVSWRYIGFHTVIFMAGLESIPESIYQAARIDGASAWEAFRDITLPMMRRVIAVSATLSIIGSLKYFDIFYVMSPEGGTRGSADLVTTYLYRTAFREHRFGYASVLAIALLVVTVAVALPAMRLLHGRREP